MHVRIEVLTLLFLSRISSCPLCPCQCADCNSGVGCHIHIYILNCTDRLQNNVFHRSLDLVMLTTLYITVQKVFMIEITFFITLNKFNLLVVRFVKCFNIITYWLIPNQNLVELYIIVT